MNYTLRAVFGDLNYISWSFFVTRLFLVTFLACSYSLTAFAQDSRLVGDWSLSNSPVALPSSATLTISSTGAAYTAALSNDLVLSAPFSCTASAGTILVDLTPLGGESYSALYSTIIPGTCLATPFTSLDVTITFADNGDSFASCGTSGETCLNWTRVGTVVAPIGNTTVPPQVNAVGGVKSISVSFQAVSGAYAYRVSIKGPVTLARTVKRGYFTKFTALAKGSYKVSYLAYFKDAKGKTASTKSSIAVKVGVKAK